MLTLVPGEMGGSESYARALCRSLGARPEVDAVAFVRCRGPTSGGGTATRRSCVSTRSGRPRSARRQRVSRGVVQAAEIAPALCSGIDVVHYPFTVPCPGVALPSVITLHDLQHLDLPEHVHARRDGVPTSRLRPRRLHGRRRDRAERVRPDRASRSVLGLDPERIVVVPHGVDHSASHPLRRGARAVPSLPCARLAAQEPRRGCSRPSSFSARRDPELSLVLTGGGTEAFAGPRRSTPAVSSREAELVDLYRRAACVVFPEPLRGVRRATARSDGVRHAGRGVERGGSLPEVCGGCSRAVRSALSGAIADGVSEALERSDELSALGLARSAGFTWEASAEGHDRAYRLAAFSPAARAEG